MVAGKCVQACSLVLLVCFVGGVFGDGVISDGAGNYAPNTNQNFNISCATNQQIVFVFDQLDLECGPDYIAITDAMHSQIYRSSVANCDTLDNVTCSTSTATILFHSDSTIEGSGFTIRWICEDRPTPSPSPSPQNNGVISESSSSGGSSTRSSYIYCGSSDTILMNLVEYNIPCNTNGLVIYDGLSRELFNSYSDCSVVLPTSISCDYSVALLNFNPSSSATSNFTVTWQCVPPSPSHSRTPSRTPSVTPTPGRQTNGVISDSGMAPASSERVHSVECLSSEAIRFDLVELSNPASTSVLSVKDGYSRYIFHSFFTSDPSLPLTIPCTTSTATVTFDPTSFANSSYTLNWKCVAAGSLPSWSNSQSPSLSPSPSPSHLTRGELSRSYDSYESSYDYVRCLSGEGALFTVWSVDIVCNRDLLYLYDQNNDQLFSWYSGSCSQQLPTTVICRTSTCILYFSSSSTYSYSRSYGYNVTWECMPQVSLPSSSPSPSPTPSIPLSGFITDGPGNYANNAIRSYAISCPSSSYQLLFTILQMDLECRRDLFAIYNADEDLLFDSLSNCNWGHLPQEVGCTTASARVAFIADSQNTDSGYNVTWQCVTPGSLPSSGVITDGDGNYANDANDVYTVRCPSASDRILLTIIQLDVECENDFLTIQDSSYNVLFTSLTKCSLNLPLKVYSPTSTAVVAFFSNSQTTNAGYNITWQCGQSFDDDNKDGSGGSSISTTTIAVIAVCAVGIPSIAIAACFFIKRRNGTKQNRAVLAVELRAVAAATEVNLSGTVGSKIPAESSTS